MCFVVDCNTCFNQGEIYKKLPHSARPHLAHENEMIVTMLVDPMLRSFSERVAEARAKVLRHEIPCDEDISDLGIECHLE
jgi:hypothetical protein